MEHRIVLTQQEAYDLSKRLEFMELTYVKDTYDGKTKTREEFNDNSNHTFKVSQKEYTTPINGQIIRFSARCKLGSIENVWFEVKWTNNNVRFEIEFEDIVPEEFKNRPNVKGWDILN